MDSIPTQHATSRDGTRIGYDLTGEGSPVILVPGIIQHRAIDTQTPRLAEILGARHLVVHYDRRGRGDSGDTLPYAPEREVEDLAALVDAVGGGPATLFGMSSGGVLALEVARLGLPVAGLALYEPPITVRPQDASPEDDLEQLQRALERGGGAAVEHFMRSVGTPEEALDGLRASPMWPAFESIGHTLVYDYTLLGPVSHGDPAALRRWADVDARTLVVDGDDSFDFMAPAADALAETLPHAVRRTLEGQSHEVDPEVLGPVLLEFLAPS